MSPAAQVPEWKQSDACRLQADSLLAANINPETGLATDYLNHFNEAIMLLDMIPDMPECADDFLAWQPLSYTEHFRQSNFKARDLAIAAYEAALPDIRERFDSVCEMLTAITIAVRDAMMETKHDCARQRLAAQAAEWLKPLVVRAGQVINGGIRTMATAPEPQSDIDLLISA